MLLLLHSQIDEKDVNLIKVGLQQEEEQKYVAGSRMSISSRRSSVSSMGRRMQGKYLQKLSSYM